MSVPAYHLIGNYEAVIEHFGEWPSFHDAEILKFEFNRRHVVKPPGPSASFDVHVFEYSAELDEHGYYKHNAHCVITFNFDNVRLVEFEGINHQNVVYEIKFAAVRDIDHIERLEVRIDASHGLSARFSADQGIVSKLVIGEPESGH